MTTIMRCNNLSVGYKKSGKITKNVISNINLDIEEGKFIAILGPNGTGKSTLVKISAAIALINILEEEVDLEPINYILQQIPIIIDMNLSSLEFPWNDGELLGFISEVIKFCAVQFPENVVPDLSKALSKLTGVQAINVIYSLLWIVFPDPPKQDAWTLNQLNKYQKMVLNVLITNDNLWIDENFEVADLSELLAEYNLPNNRKDLKKLLQLDSK